MPTKPSRSPSPAARSASPVARSLSPPVKGGGTPAKKTPAKSSGLPPVKAAGKPPVGGKRPPSAPKPGEFIASKKWDGPRTGMAFRNGPFGQGYYADDKVDNAATTTAGGAAHTPASAASSERELDAAEVFAMLPISMQVAFEARRRHASRVAGKSRDVECQRSHTHRPGPVPLKRRHAEYMPQTTG